MLNIFKGTNANKDVVVDLRKAEIYFEKALKSIGKENEKQAVESAKAFLEKEKLVKKLNKDYDKDKKKYQSLNEAEKQAWLKEKGYKAEDFDEDVTDALQGDLSLARPKEELDKTEEIRYSYKARDPKTVTEKEFKHHYWAVANNLLSKEELGVLDDAIANIYSGDYYKNINGLYMIPVGENGVLDKIVFTDGNFETYSIDTIVEIDNKDVDILTIERENVYACESNGIQTETKGILKVYSSKDFRFSDYRRNDNENLQNHNGKQNGTRSSREIRFVIEDSDGNTLSPDQREFFNNSKVLDDDGNLLVLYHGSKVNETIFDERYISSWNMFGKGFYFTTSKKRAMSYAKGSLKEVYINLKNPFFANKREHLNKLYKEINNTKKDIEQYSDEKGVGGREFFKICNYLDDVGVDVSKILQGLGYDGIYYEGYEDIEIVAYESNQIKLTSNKKPTKSKDIRFSKKITANMTDSERFDILKNKKIENIPISKGLTKEQLDNIQSITSFEDLNKYFGAEKRSIIKKIASEFGVFKEYYNKDVELTFDFSNRGFEESYSKQKHHFVSYAKMFSVFDGVVEKAVGIEVHNRNVENYKRDKTLKNVYVLASAFFDGENIVPVKLEVKEFSDKKNTLYVAIALESIKKDGVSEQEVAKGVAQQYSRPSTISIRDLLKNVNPNDKDFYKYIPKQFFNEDSEIVKFSLKDSDGNTLSPEQQEFFKDSKVRDEKGSLQVVYHATNAVFNKIDFKKNAQGVFWFASSKEDLLSGNVSTPGIRNRNSINIMELYANIKKPATWEEYDKYGIQQLKDLGYDGAILEENGEFVGFVFNGSNQVKLTTNTNPTTNADIRFSKSGNEIKQQANLNRKKVYTKKDAEATLNTILDDVFEEYPISISGKNREQVVEDIWKALNTLEEGKRTGFALKVS